MNIFLFISGLLCIAYDITLICLNPGTFIDNLLAFTHIWSILGTYLIFLAVYRKKTGHSFWKTFSRKLKIAVSTVLIAGAAIAFVNLFFILTPKISSVEEEADYVIVLGGGISKDGTLPAPVISRIEKTADYLKRHKQAVCVVTGGALYWLPYAESPEIKNQLIQRGIEKDRILIEDKSLDTIQNLQYSVDILSQSLNVLKSDILKSRVLIVTSRYHLARAERLARRMGFTNVKGIPSACPPFYIIHDYVREICSYIKLNLRILFTSKPARIV